MCAHEPRALHRQAGDEARSKAELAAAGHSGDLERVRRAIGDPSPSLRATALGALGRLGALDLQALAAGLCDEDSAVRRRAAELSHRAGLDKEGVAALLLPLLDDEPEVVEAACTALGELGLEEAVDELGQVATGSADPLCREAAVAALGSIGAVAGLCYILAACEDRPAIRRRAVLALAPFEGPAVKAALERALSDRDWQVRQAAEDLSEGRPWA
jgi:HEAT repeat protein